MNLVGRWKGSYSYGPEDPRPQVEFVIEIIEDAGGVFKGTVHDGEGGHPMAGRISGRLDDTGEIKFKKLMLSTMLSNSGRGADLLEGITQTIDYQGSSDGPNAFEGIWTNRSRVVFARGAFLFFQGNHGPWRMWRDS